MKRLAENTPPQAPSGSGVGLGEVRRPRSDADHGLRNQVNLEIAADALPGMAIQALMDDWLIPMIVEAILVGRIEAPGDGDGRH